MDPSASPPNTPAPNEVGLPLPPPLPTVPALGLPAISPPSPSRSSAPSSFKGGFSLLAALLAAPLLARFTSGEVSSFLACSQEATLLGLLGILIHLGTKHIAPRALAWIILSMLIVGLASLNVFAPVFIHAESLTQKGLRAAMKPEVLKTALQSAALSLLAALIGLLALSKHVRALLAPLTGRCLTSHPHVFALVATLSVTALALSSLLSLGEPALLASLPHFGFTESTNSSAASQSILKNDLYSLCWSLAASALAVGYGIRRNFRQTLVRLGIRPLTGQVFWLSIVLTSIVLLINHFTDKKIDQIWTTNGWPVTNQSSLDILFSAYSSLSGAIVLSMVAGLGEEVLVRGILQPRLGILLSNVFFTALHAYQYHWDALASVFVTGLCLALIRSRTSTTVSACVHAGFDLVLCLKSLPS